jgi:hypothetical protein
MPRLRRISWHRRNAANESLAPDNITGTDPQSCIEMPADHGSAGSPSKERQDYLLGPPSLQQWPSPVKARAALFERMQYHVSGEYIPDGYNRDDNTTTSSIRSISRKLETENNVPRSIQIPRIELALSPLISHRRRHSQGSSGSGQSENCPYDMVGGSKTPSVPVTQPQHDRKAPITWPFKWNLFPHDKANPAPPKSSGVEAKAETGNDEHATDVSMEQLTSHIYVSPVKPAPFPRRGPNQKRVVGGETTDNGVTNQVSSVKERAKVFTGRPMSNIAIPQDLQKPHSEGNPEEPRTPKKRTVLRSTQSATPIKPVTPQLKRPAASSPPRTPFRGRSRSARGGSYVAEQKYPLSRSRSNGGVKILVEVSSPGPSPDRANNDTVVIIRANVEPLGE